MKAKALKLGVVVVDMQPKYLGDINVVARECLISGIEDLIRSCKRRGLPVAVVEYADSGKTIIKVRRSVTTLPRNQRKVITKWHCSAFNGTKLGAFLRSQGVGTIIVAGVHASYCVRETVDDAIKAGYRVITAPDLIADNPTLSTRAMWKWYGQNTTFYAHSAELIGIEIG